MEPFSDDSKDEDSEIVCFSNAADSDFFVESAIHPFDKEMNSLDLADKDKAIESKENKADAMKKTFDQTGIWYRICDSEGSSFPTMKVIHAFWISTICKI